MESAEACQVALESRGSMSSSRSSSSSTTSEQVVESWEMVDLADNIQAVGLASEEAAGPIPPPATSSSSGDSDKADSKAARAVEQVDSFLREALQNNCDRLTVLRLEQEVERFIRNPKSQQLEFQPMPSSYLRLAAHRVAQHYFLQSIVVDSGSAEGTRIVARKTGETRYPAIRLADIPVDMPLEEKLVSLPMPKVAIKQRPPKGGRANGDGGGGGGGYGSKLNPSKSVEERKEEYNKARARIFCGENGVKSCDGESLVVDGFPMGELVPSIEVVNLQEKAVVEEIRENVTRSLSECSPPGSRNNGNGKAEKENMTRAKFNNRVAIFRDREKDRRDPDYDRNFDRYSQRFDPGFGVNVGPFGVQAIYAPLTNYNTEFPQLGGIQRPQIVMEPPLPPPIPQHMRGPWGAPVGSLGFRPGNGHMGPYNPGRMAPHASMIYMHGPQYGYPGPNMGYMHPAHDHFQQSISQTHPQQPDAGFNQARCR